MSSLEAEANERRKRIALLRAQRRGRMVDRDDGMHEEEVKVKVKVNEKVNEEVKEEDDEDDEDEEETNNETTNPYNQTHHQSQPNKTNISPILQISGNETVEVLAKEIQDSIFNKSRDIALTASQPVSKPPQTKTNKSDLHNKDLKQALQSEIILAENRTSRAVNSILQDKFHDKLK